VLGQIRKWCCQAAVPARGSQWNPAMAPATTRCHVSYIVTMIIIIITVIIIILIIITVNIIVVIIITVI
jgi:hypothetical protein